MQTTLPRSARCLVLARSMEDAFTLTRAPGSTFLVSLHLPLPDERGAFVLACDGYHGYGSTINAQVGGRTTTIGWRLRSGDPARRLVSILVDSADPTSVVTSARGEFLPSAGVEYIPPPLGEPHPGEAPIAEEPVPSMASRSITAGPFRQTMFQLVREVAAQEDVSPAFVLALVHEESRFNPHAVSSQGAIGLGQLMPATAAQHAVRDLFDPVANIRGTIAHLKHLAARINSVPGTLVSGASGPSMLLAAYRSGLGNIRTRGINANDWKYIHRIEVHWRMYQRMLSDALIQEDPIGAVLILRAP